MRNIIYFNYLFRIYVFHFCLNDFGKCIRKVYIRNVSCRDEHVSDYKNLIWGSVLDGSFQPKG